MKKYQMKKYRDDRRSSCFPVSMENGVSGGLLNLSQFLVFSGEEKRRRAHCNDVCDRLRDEYGQNLIAKEMRQDKDKRNQEQNFSKQGEKDGSLRIAQGDKGLLA